MQAEMRAKAAAKQAAAKKKTDKKATKKRCAKKKASIKPKAFTKTLIKDSKEEAGASSSEEVSAAELSDCHDLELFEELFDEEKPKGKRISSSSSPEVTPYNNSLPTCELAK